MNSPKSKLNILPFICEGANKSVIEANPLRLVKTLHTNGSYYLIQNESVWFLNDEKYDERTWPMKFSNIFPNINGPIDAILFDDIKKEFLIFKVCFLFFPLNFHLTLTTLFRKILVFFFYCKEFTILENERKSRRSDKAMWNCVRLSKIDSKRLRT